MQCQDFSGAGGTPPVLCLIRLNERCFKIDLAFFDGKVKIKV